MFLLFHCDRFCVVILIASVSLSVANSDFELKCLVTHLRNDEIQEELLSPVESVSEFTLCTEIIASNLRAFYDKVAPDASEKFVNCLKKGVEGSGLKNAYLLAEAVRRFDVGWKLWKIQSQEKRNKKLAEVLDAGLKVVQDQCNDVVIKENFGSDFDKLVQIKRSLQGETEYCVRKHLVSLDIMDVYSYNLNLNPQRINTNYDCTDLINNLQGDTYREMKKFVSDCRINIYRENNYMEYFMKIEFVLPHLNLSPNEIAVEREMFIQKANNIRKKTLTGCTE